MHAYRYKFEKLLWLPINPNFEPKCWYIGSLNLLRLIFIASDSLSMVYGPFVQNVIDTCIHYC